MKDADQNFVSENYKNALEQAAKRAGLKFDESVLEKSLAYTEQLIEWNKVMNLTGLTSPEDIAIRHFLDSWMLLEVISKFWPTDKNLRLIDVGTGAGFPGLPLKIAMPEIRLVLLDSLQKRVRFLKQIVEVTELKDVECLHGRAEETARRKGYRDSFNLATARAVAALPELTEYCLPFVKPGGLFIAMKSDAADELKQAGKAIRLLKGEIEEVLEFDLPGTDMKRSLIVIRKTGMTPPIYPRKAGKPHISPLL